MDTWTRGLDIPLVAQRTSFDSHESVTKQRERDTAHQFEHLRPCSRDYRTDGLSSLFLCWNTQSPLSLSPCIWFCLSAKQGGDQEPTRILPPGPASPTVPWSPRTPVPPHVASTQPSPVNLRSQWCLHYLSTPGTWGYITAKVKDAPHMEKR